MALEAGRILHERYRLIRPIGHGSQASVWIAEHLALTTTVAVKLIDPELAKKESARERFRREATAAAQLRSAHVVQIIDHGIEGDQPFIVMELLDGEDLFERLTHRTRISLRETSKVVTQVARALTRAHAAGIVHRDLKPENIFLVPNDDDEVVKVLDFGVAKFKDPGKAAMQRTGLGTLIGTPHYMSPEQVKGISEIDYRADLWALGVIAFQCVTGELPFDSEGVGDLLIKISIGDIPVPSKIFPSIPANFDAWFLRACDRDPAKRFQSAREMAVALGGVVGVFGEGGVRQPTVRPPGKISIFPAAAPAPAPAPAPSAPKAPVPGKPPAPRPAPYAPAWANKPAPKPSEELEELESVDEDDWDEAPTRMKPSRDSIDSTDIDFDEPDDRHDRMSHAGFPLITRAQPPPSAGRPARQSPPPPAPSHPAAPPSRHETPAEASPPRESRPTPPPRPSAPRQPLPPGNPFTDVSAPAPPVRIDEARSSDTSGVPSSGLRPSTVSGLARSGLMPTDPPPELDGSRRRRMVRVLAIGLVIGAAGVAWGVFRSQGGRVTIGADSIEVPSAAPPPPSASAAPTPTMAIPSFTAAAIDPGKVSRPTKPTPTAKPGPGTAPRPRPKKPPADGVIEVPDGPPDDSLAPAP
jgi:serine/threonine-protein kinase